MTQVVVILEINNDIKNLNNKYVFLGADFACPKICFSGTCIPIGNIMKKTISQFIKKTTTIEGKVISIYLYEYL